MTDQLTDFRRQLHDAGVTDLEALLVRIDAEGSTDPVEEEYRTETTPARHLFAPAVDLIVDGERHDAKVYNQFEGIELHSTPGQDAQGEPVLYSFTTTTGLTEHLRATEARASALDGDVGTSNPDSLSVISSYFEHAGLDGDRLQNNPGWAWQDLTRVRHGFLGLGNWNDLISSLDWCRWDVILYEHVNYTGATFHARGGYTYKWLSNYGWNDRASSVWNTGFRF